MRRSCERGVALLVTLLLMVAVVLLGASASTMVMLGEQAARAERDRLIAFQAAEDALMDGENDIESARSPVVIPVPPAPAPPAPASPAPAPPAPAPPALAALSASSSAAAPGEAGAAEAWCMVDLAGDAATAFGALSGAVMETGEGTQPFRRPRYFAERLERPGGGYYYRVTVIGFGNRPGTEAVLQSTYRRIADAQPGKAGRLSWREISNWRELHSAAAGKKEKP